MPTNLIEEIRSAMVPTPGAADVIVSEGAYHSMVARQDGNATVTDLYIMGAIGERFFSKGNTTETVATALAGRDNSGDLIVHVSSRGGDAVEALGIFNAIRAWQGSTVSRIYGIAASAGMYIAMAADRIEVYKTSRLMLHAARFSYDPYYRDDVQRQNGEQSLAQINSALREILDRRMTKAQADTVMGEIDTWYTPAQAKRAGLIDEVIEVEPNRVDAFTQLMVASAGNWQIPPSKSETGDVELTAEQKAAALAAAMQSIAAALDTTVDKLTAEQKAAAQALVDAAIKAAAPPPTPEPEPTPAPEADDKTNLVAQVGAMFQPHGEKFEEIRVKALAGEITIKAASEQLLAELGKANEAVAKLDEHGNPVVSKEAKAEQARDKYVDDAVAALMHRAGAVKVDADSLKDNPLKGAPLIDIGIRAAVEFGGVEYKDIFAMSAMERAGALLGMNAAFGQGTDVFKNISENVMNKSLLAGYEEQPEVYPTLTRKRSVSDFKTQTLVDLGTFGDLDKLGEFSEYKHAELEDFKETFAIGTYGKLMSFSRVAIINDDMDLLSSGPARMGAAVKRQMGQQFIDLLTTNGNLSDGTALFHADHGNLIATALSTKSLDSMRTKMRTQKDRSDIAIVNIVPRYLLVPAALEGQAQKVLNSPTDIAAAGAAQQGNAAVINIAQHMSLTPLSDGRLDGSSTTRWYTFGDPNAYDGIGVAYLDGNEEPFTERDEMFTRDGYTLKIRHDWAFFALDHRPLFRGGA